MSVSVTAPIRPAGGFQEIDWLDTMTSSCDRSLKTRSTESEREAVIAMRLAEFDRAVPPPDDDPVAIKARIAQLVADPVEPARLEAYDELEDGRRALSIAVRWLGPKILADGSLGPKLLTACWEFAVPRRDCRPRRSGR